MAYPRFGSGHPGRGHGGGQRRVHVVECGAGSHLYGRYRIAGLGTGMAALALATNTHLLLPIIGGLFVMETLSVIIQVFSFRVFGTRVFRMAPIHHHFELGGWPETTVIIRLWIMTGFATAVAVGLFYADFVSIGGAD